MNYILTNRKNGKKVTVNQEDFDAIKNKGWLKTVFTFEEAKGNFQPKGSYVPPEVAKMDKTKKKEDTL